MNSFRRFLADEGHAPGCTRTMLVGFLILACLVVVAVVVGSMWEFGR